MAKSNVFGGCRKNPPYFFIIPVLNGQKPEGRGKDRKNIGREKRGRTGALTMEAATTITITKGRAIRLRCSRTGAYGRLKIYVYIWK